MSPVVINVLGVAWNFSRKEMCLSKQKGLESFGLRQFVDDSGIKRQILLRGARIIKRRMETTLVYVGPFCSCAESYSANSCLHNVDVLELRKIRKSLNIQKLETSFNTSYKVEETLIEFNFNQFLFRSFVFQSIQQIEQSSTHLNFSYRCISLFL